MEIRILHGELDNKSNKMTYRYNNVEKILAFVVMGCPLCNQKFRTKAFLRVHLHSEHTDSEAEKFLEDNE